MAVSLITLTVLICAATVYYWEYLSHLQNYGYIGAFVFGFLAGSSLPLPLPYIVVTFTLGGVLRPIDVLSPVLVGLASGLGAGIGGTLFYLFGRSGRSLLFDTLAADNGGRQPSPRMAKFLEWANRRGSMVVFFISAMPNPAFAPMAIAIGAIRYRLPKFFLWCTAGNIVKSTAIAYCGYFGLGTLFRLVNWIDIF